MPSLKRKLAASSKSDSGPSKRTQLAPVSAEHDETDGMMRAAMEDDMIDDDDEEDEEDDEEADSEDVDEFGDMQGSEDDEDMQFQDLEAGSDDGEQEQGQSASATKGKGKANKNDLFKPPTAEEIRMLRSKEDRGGGFDFGMKISALLQSTLLQPPEEKSVKPSPPPQSLTAFLTSIHTHLLSLPSLPALPVRAASQRLAGLRIPFTEPSPLDVKGEEPKWKLGWEKPAEVFVCGSWSVLGGYKKGRRQVSTKDGKGKHEVEVGSIDLGVLMPDDLFTPKDRLSNRYFNKRAHYLAVIASSLLERVKNAKNNDGDVWSGVEVEWELMGGDSRRPVVVVTLPKDKARGLKHRYSVRLLPTVRPGLFPVNTLYPSKANLRIIPADHQPSESEPAFSPSPLYNTSILLDSTHRAHLLACHALNKSCPAFGQAVALWRIWGERRGLTMRSGGGSAGWAWVGQMVFGVTIDGGAVGSGKRREETKPKKGLGRGLTEWQLFKAGLEFLASTDFHKTPVFMKTMADAEEIPHNEFIAGFRDIFVDVTGTINIWATWEQGELQLLRHEARTTLAMLADTTHDHFDDVFLRPMQSSALKFDEVIRLDTRTLKERGPVQDSVLLLELPPQLRKASAVASTIRQALGNRARVVTVQCNTPTSWTMSSERPHPPSSILEVGLLLDKTEASRVLDQGPTSEQSELSAAFREFWGEKAELRRFKDGSITESVIWHVARPEERALIPGKIVARVVDRHFNIKGNFIAWTSPDMQKILQIPPTSHRLKMVEGSEKLGFRPAMDAFDKLYKTIKAADDDLPLSILNFTPASEYLRYTSTFVPHPVDIARMQAAPSSVRYMPAFDVMMQFESSGKWPDDLVAVQKIKLAFMEKLARLLEDKIADVSVKIVLEPGAPDIQDHASLEVVVSEGFAFHLRIFHDRERTLLLRMVEDPDLSSPKLRKIALESLRLHVRRYTLLPRHHSAIATLHHMHPSFATATRLLKRWISAHMLSQHLSGEFVELVTAGVYLTGGPSGIPATAIAGFYRALYRLAHWDWKGIPMIVPLYTATTENKDNNPADTTNVSFRSDLMSSALAQFKEERKSDPHCLRTALCVVTEEDLDGTVWTRSNESGKVIAGRLVTLARAACEVLAQAGSDSMDLPAETFFRTPLAHFDFVLHLDRSAVYRLDQNVQAHDATFAKQWAGRVREARDGDGEVAVTLDPAAQYCADLQRLYGSTILLFHDLLGGTAIGGLWNPAIEPRRNFKAFLGFSSKPADSDDRKSSSMVEANKEDMLEEMARIGAGIVAKIEVHKH